jgi:hypothetical protein
VYDDRFVFLINRFAATIVACLHHLPPNWAVLLAALQPWNRSVVRPSPRMLKKRM